jgi:deoxyribodipyrimidine photo-lyase
MTTIVWFRQDLRLHDNPALAEATKRGAFVPVYIEDTSAQPLGGAGRWWLHHSLAALTQSLGRLVLRRGNPAQILPKLADDTKADAVFWNRCYEPHAIARDTALKQALSTCDIDARSFGAALLHEPWDIKTGAGGPFKVYSPFWRACLQRPVVRPLACPAIQLAARDIASEVLTSWELLPSRPNWAKGWERQWSPGEDGAQQRLSAFLDDGLDGYATLRDRPDLPKVSRLSPHLHWGEISPRQIWTQVNIAADSGTVPRKDADKFLAEIGWREFASHLLFHFPDLPHKNWKPAFDAYPWRENAADLKAWQRGRTGYPLVDAGMRELWATGTMHNRVRMVAASFLVKHLRIDWRQGAAWFWDTLADADLANNSASWQWVAGSGADAAPYFRIFNPTEQARRFDPEGVYIRRWCPELAKLPAVHIHAPFDAPPDVLAQASVTLGTTYPSPIVDHRAARAAALEGYGAIKISSTEG